MSCVVRPLAALLVALSLPVHGAAASSNALAVRSEAPAPEAPVADAPVADAPVAAGPIVDAPTPSEPAAATQVDTVEASTDDVPPPELTPEARDDLAFDARADETREMGATAMLATGLLTVAGVVLVLAGFGATATAIKRSDCEQNDCTKDRRVRNAARVTAAGLYVSSVGAIGFIAGAAVYGVGKARMRRAEGRTRAFGFAPTHGGVSASVGGRF